MGTEFFSEKQATQEKYKFGIRFRISYLALFTSVWFSLSWTINVGITRYLYYQPSHRTPAISDATFNRYQHPYYVLCMTSSMSLLFILSLFVRTVQFYKPSSWRGYMCDFGMVSALIATISTAISTAVVVWSPRHFLFGMLGGAGTGIWLVNTAIFPPCAATKPWMNHLLRVIAILAGSGGLIGASSFTFSSYKTGAIGEYISVGGFCVFLAAMAVKIHGYEVTIQERANIYCEFPETMKNLHVVRLEEGTDYDPVENLI